jgi:hypothetical protein
MLTTVLKWTMGTAFLGSLFWWSAGDCTTLLLAVWMVAIGILVYSNLADRFLWIPLLLALAGVFGSIFVIAIPGSITLAANVATLVTFIVSVEVLKKKHRSAMAVMRHRAL